MPGRTDGGERGEERQPDEPPAASGRQTFGWRAGALLGVVVLVVVYAIAELTAAVPPLRDAVEHQPVTIAVLIVGTAVVLLSLLPRPVRRG